MAESTVVRASIDAKTKAEAAAVLAAMGLTVSDAFRLLMVRVAKEKALPFEPLRPNATDAPETVGLAACHRHSGPARTISSLECPL